MGPASPSDPVGTESVPVPDMSPVLSFLSGKNCLNGVSLFVLHGTRRSQYALTIVCCVT
jgi:hypothetical protein